MIYKVGDKVPGKTPPHGGRWEYSPEADELTLIEAPTAEAETGAPVKAEEEEKE